MLVLLMMASQFVFGSSFQEGFETLTHGDTYYKKIEPSPGAPYLVFVHGGTVYCSHGSFDRYMEQLASTGQNVMCFDHYGSGKSAAWTENAQFNQNEFEQQLNELLDKRPETAGQQNYILGSSAGACITARYTSTYPEKVAKVGFISPAIDVMSTKGVREKFGIWLFKQFPESKTLHNVLRDKIRDRTKEVVQECKTEIKNYIGQMIDRETKDDQFVNNFYRKVIGDVFADCREPFDKVVKLDTPFFAASGALDTEVPIETFRQVFKENQSPQDTYIEFDEAGHGLQCRETQRLVREIASFIKTAPEPGLRGPASAQSAQR